MNILRNKAYLNYIELESISGRELHCILIALFCSIAEYSLNNKIYWDEINVIELYNYYVTK